MPGAFYDGRGVAAGSAFHPADRGPLLESFRSNYPDFEGDDAALLAQLQGEYRTALGEHLGLNADSHDLDFYADAYRPVWNNEAQRQAMMAIAASPDGMEKVRNLFPGEYDEGDLPGDGGERYLLPPGARKVLEARRAAEYLERLLDEDRVLTEPDVAIGTGGGGNFYRDDKSNWFGFPAAENGPAPLTPLGGPNYYGAQESPAAVGVALDPYAPVTTGMLGAMGMIPNASRYAISSGSPLRGVDNAIRLLRRSLNNNGLTEMPTANVSPVNALNRPSPFQNVDAQKMAMKNQADFAASMPDQGQQLAENLVPDKYNSEALGFGLDVALDAMDHTGIPSVAKSIASPRKALGIAANDMRNEAVMGVAMGGYGSASPEDDTRTGAERAAAREVERQAASARLDDQTPVRYVEEVVSEGSEPFQRMTARNPYLQLDRLKEARSRLEADRQRSAEKPSLFAYRAM